MKGRKVVKVALLTVVIACGIAAIAFMLSDAHETEKYEKLEEESNADVKLNLDWLQSYCPGAVAWLRVANTSISYPVMQASGDDPEFYLSHDAWGEASGDGVPFLDSRCTNESDNLLVFGHHIIFTNRVFSPIYRAFDQQVFNGIGEATWDTGNGYTTFKPLMAMSVDKEYAPIQHFKFTSVSEMRAWLTSMESAATAHSDGWTEDISSAKRVLTLVTCSSDLSGQRRRTLLIFVA